jgi:muramoyltetrapeptide carboxypeptidase
VAVTTATRGGLARFRPAGPGSRVALVAPASPFKRAEFEAGLSELRALDFVPVFDDRVFERDVIVAGPAAVRAAALAEYLADPGIDAVLAVRGGSGSAETLPLLDPALIRSGRTAFVGYSDVTAVHTFLNCHAGLASVHGPMIEGRLASGSSAYDRASFLAGLSGSAAGPLAPASLETLTMGEASGPMYGGTLTQLLASFGTPFAFQPPAGAVLLIDEVGERPYRIRRMLTQLAQAGVLGRVSAVVFGQLPGCDEPGGELTARAVVADWFRTFPGPVLFGFPTGHATSPLVTVPLGVDVRVVGTRTPALVVEESAAS